ncbi:MAG: Dabb family protein [Phycisphaerales bacterium]|nr:Dabb family protein [Phycisphaerales bacterium]
MRTSCPTSRLCWLAPTALILSLAACGSHHPSGPPTTIAHPATPASLNHLVFFKLKNPAEADALVTESRETLGRIPGVISLFAGRHLDAGRPSVETAYDACVYVGFADAGDYAAYLTHPEHTSLVSRWKDRFEWFKVYDIHDASFTTPPDAHGR